jgi:pSer/pThr/pTyr-binding forkhead associated (FHA) protein
LPAGQTTAPKPVAAIGGQTGAVPRLIGESGNVHRVTGSSTILGRKSDCGIVLNGDPHVSGHHARLDWSGGVCRLTDLGSTNGSRVGGERIAPGNPVSLTDGVTITLGNTRLTFRMAD